MKKAFLIFLYLIIMNIVVRGQTYFSKMPDSVHSGGIIYNGFVTKYDLQNEVSFTWYNANAQNYTPSDFVQQAFIASRDSVKYLVFGGTWCEDTQFIIPKFFKLQELANIPNENISFVAVDRQKKSYGNLPQIFGIKNVPTIIVFKNNLEIGRVVEYGKTGKWDEELAALIK